MSGIYDVNLPAGGIANIAALGSYLKIRSAPYGLVEVKLDGGESYLLDEGLGIRLPDGKSFRDVSVRNKSPTQQTVLVFIGDTHFEDTRVTGFVSVTNKIGALTTQFELSGGVLLPIGFLATSIITPAANARGILVRKAIVSATGGASGNAELRLIAAPVVPVSTVPPNGYNLASVAPGATMSSVDIHQDQNYQLPGGWGVWGGNAERGECSRIGDRLVRLRVAVSANAAALSVVAAAVLLLVLANRRVDVAAAVDSIAGAGDGSVPLEDGSGDAEQGQGGGAVETALATIDPLTYWPTMQAPDTEQANIAAGLMTIRKAEGTAGADGYRTMFGYRLFTDFSDHPRQPAQFNSNGRQLWTSAAGAYQFMAVSQIPGGGSTRVDTWDRMKARLGLPDFSPASQDAAALGLISDAGALNDLKAGRFDSFVSKVRSIWASLPGAGYGQPERSLASLRDAFTNAGGTLA